MRTYRKLLQFRFMYERADRDGELANDAKTCPEHFVSAVKVYCIAEILFSKREFDKEQKLIAVNRSPVTSSSYWFAGKLC